MSAFPFSELSVPTLVLHGTEDKNVPFATAEFAASMIPDAELVAIENGPHEFFLICHRACYWGPGLTPGSLLLGDNFTTHWGAEVFV
jgi:hypothetical protein